MPQAHQLQELPQVEERYRKLDRASLDPEQQRIFDDIARPRKGHIPAPFHVFLESPELCQLIQAVGAFCRYRTGLSPRASETAILVTAIHWGAEYEFEVHVPEALKAGVRESEIEAYRRGETPQIDDPESELVYRFTTTFYATKEVPDDLYEEAIARLGRRTVTELVAVLGYYSLLAISMRVFRIPAFGAD